MTDLINKNVYAVANFSISGTKGIKIKKGLLRNILKYRGRDYREWIHIFTTKEEAEKMAKKYQKIGFEVRQDRF